MDTDVFSLNHQVAIHVADEGWSHWNTADEWQTYSEQVICRVLKCVGWMRSSEISLMLTNDAHMQELNHTYRHKDKPTNVLSFPSFQRGELATVSRMHEPVVLGDVVLSLETVLKESQDQKKLFLHHFTHLLVHGTLHLMGYDHEDEREAEEMEALEVLILDKFGMTNPYQ